MLVTNHLKLKKIIFMYNYFDKTMSTYCNACDRSYKQIKSHLKTKKHKKNTLLLEESQETHKCSICLDDISSNELKTTECDHHFHKDCIENWRRVKNNCPNCRHILPSLQPPLAVIQRRNYQRRLINGLIETIHILEQFEHVDPNILNNARMRLMQLLNNF